MKKYVNKGKSFLYNVLEYVHNVPAYLDHKNKCSFCKKEYAISGN